MTRLIALLALAAPHVDQYGDPLPEGAITRFGTVRFRVGAFRERNAHALSPDGQYLAVDDRYGIAIWDTQTGKVAQRLPWRTSQGDSPKLALCYSPDGKRLARVAGRVVALWDLTTGKETFDIDFTKEGNFHALAFVPGADHLVVLSETSPRAFTIDAKTGRIVKEQQLDAPARFVSTSGRRYLGWIDAALHVLDAATGKQICQTTGLVRTFDAPPVLSPDDRRLYLADRTGRLQTFDANTGKLLENLEAPKDWDDDGWRAELTLSPDGTVAFLTKHGLATRRRDLKAAKWLDPLPLSPGGTFLTLPNVQQGLLVGDDGVLRRYDLATLKELPTTTGFEGSVFASPSPDGRRVVIKSGDSSVRSQLGVFDLSGRPLWAVDPGVHSGTPWWSPDGRLLACVANRTITIRDAATGAAVQTLAAPPRCQFERLVFFPPGGTRVITPLSDAFPDGLELGSTVAAFDLTSGKQAGLWEPGIAWAKDLSVNGRHLVYNSLGRGLRLFDLVANKFCSDWIDPPTRDGQISFGTPRFSPDGSYLLTWELEPRRQAWRSRDSVAVLRDPRTGERQASVETGLSSEFEWSFSPDGLWFVATVGRGGFAIHETATGQRVEKREGHRDHISNIQFAGSGRVLTSSEDLTALLWDIRPKERPSKPLWEALSGADAKEAWRAIWTIADDPRGPELLRAKITPVKPIPTDLVDRLLVDLGADRYAIRELASKRLQELGRLLEPDIRAILTRTNSEEVRTRANVLLSKIAPERTPQEYLHARAVAAMELAGTTDARKLLAEWASGASGARLTLDAQGALGRLKVR